MLNSLFNQIFVLTIERNQDRHGHVETILSGIDFTYWYGTDIPQLFPDEKSVFQIPDSFFHERSLDKETLRHYSKGQFGAYLSIKEMVEHVSKNNLSRVLMFEDDFVPLYEDWQQRIADAVNELPDDWHILLLGYGYSGRVYQLSKYRLLRPLIKRLTSARPVAKRFSKHLDFLGLGYGGHAYCISKAGADHLCTYFNPMRLAGDHLIGELIKRGEINAFGIYPALFVQDRKRFGTKTNVSD